MSALPALMPLTTPVLETLATLVADDCHTDCVVTACVVRSDMVASAVNPAVPPTKGAAPETTTAETVGGGAVGAADDAGVVGEPPPLHAHATPAMPRAAPTEPNQRLISIRTG